MNTKPVARKATTPAAPALVVGQKVRLHGERSWGTVTKVLKTGFYGDWSGDIYGRLPFDDIATVRTSAPGRKPQAPAKAGKPSSTPQKRVTGKVTAKPKSTGKPLTKKTTGTPKPVIGELKITNFEVRVDGDPKNGWIVVSPVWSNVGGTAKIERPSVRGVLMKTTHQKRYQDACLAGAVFVNPRLKDDTNGRSYVASDCKVNARHMPSDLKRIGF